MEHSMKASNGTFDESIEWNNPSLGCIGFVTFQRLSPSMSSVNILPWWYSHATDMCVGHGVIDNGMAMMQRVAGRLLYPRSILYSYGLYRFQEKSSSRAQ